MPGENIGHANLTYDMAPLGGDKLDAHTTLYDTIRTLGKEATIPCREFPRAYFSGDIEELLAAAYACHRCPVIDLCGDYASTDPAEECGVWGGRVYPLPAPRRQVA